MGEGYSIVCKHCQYQTSVMTGIGMSFPSVYRDIISDIELGRYGTEWKSFMENTPGAAIHIGMEVYQCPHCRAIVNEPNLSLYKAKEKSTKAEPFMYWMASARTHQFIKSFQHKCPECNHRLKRLSLDKHEPVFCPHCGEEAEATIDILWD